MLDLLRDVFKSDAGSFGFVFALVCLVIYVVHRVTKFTTKIETEHGEFAKRVDKIESNTDKIKEDLILIRASILSKVSLTEIQSQSPLSLTTAGSSLAKELNIDTRIASNWGKIEAYVDANVHDKNAYDIQQFCIEKSTIDLSLFLSDSDIREIKLIAFNKGRSIESFGSVIGITIRDAYFKHKGIDIGEVDKNDPTKSTINS
ncbi:MAG: hypothetical protein LBD52_02135 [Prevotellaceae bacterium]|jgi:Na+-transporting methylmalonyl-CoA/oxaloacetate decarboxylase gamma subunit|nr:hypothetical protein [Prevotellaceae bacterium]